MLECLPLFVISPNCEPPVQPLTLPHPPVPLRVAAASAVATLRALVPPGAVVEAQVLRVTAAATTQAAYDVLLAIGSRTLSIVTTRPLEAGTRIRLASDGQQLQILPPATSPARGGPARSDLRLPPAVQTQQPAGAPAAAPTRSEAARQKIAALIDSALRNALPREQPMKPILRALQQALSAPDTPLAESSKQLVREVFARLPDLAGVQDPQRLAKAMRRTGMFLEHALLQPAGSEARSVVGEDLRVALLRLAADLRARLDIAGGTAPAPSRQAAEQHLLERVESALALVKVKQLSTLNARLHSAPDAPAPPRLSLELPFLHGAQIETVQLTIGKEETRPESAQPKRDPAWTVGLDFELGELGALHVRARLQQKQLTAVFWAPRDATLSLVKRHIATLREDLARHDLSLQHIAYQQGSPPARPAHPRPLLHVAI